MSKPFAIVTGASSGIGLELAVMCAQEGLTFWSRQPTVRFTRPPIVRALGAQT